jgi:hypothetical protein
MRKIESSTLIFQPKLQALFIFRSLQIDIAPLLMVKHFRPLLNKSERPIVINISSWLGSRQGRQKPQKR